MAVTFTVTRLGRRSFVLSRVWIERIRITNYRGGDWSDRFVSFTEEEHDLYRRVYGSDSCLDKFLALFFRQRLFSVAT